MTPFGQRIRKLREERGISQARMAHDIGVSAAYLSAMEHGKRSRPTPGLVRQICGYLNIIWDEADALIDLAKISRPKVVLDTSGLTPKATELANLLAEKIRHIPDPVLDDLYKIIDDVPVQNAGKHWSVDPHMRAKATRPNLTKKPV